MARGLNSDIMRNRIFSRPLSAAAGLAVLAFSAMPVAAQTFSNSVTPSNPDQTATPAQTKPVQLSYGASDVLKLSRAHVSDGTIIAFIQGSETIYNLGADEIVYLRQQGVSDSVIAAMLSQRQRITDAAARVAQSSSYPDANTARPAPTYDQAKATYAQSQAEYVPPSTVYVVPSSSPVYVDYGYYPYYGGYYGNYYPPVSFSIGFGGYRGWGGRGGFHGGGFHSGHRR
jgi:hypothetical protein